MQVSLKQNDKIKVLDLVEVRYFLSLMQKQYYLLDKSNVGKNKKGIKMYVDELVFLDKL